VNPKSVRMSFIEPSKMDKEHMSSKRGCRASFILATDVVLTKAAGKQKAEIHPKNASRQNRMKLADLNVLHTIGVGEFGSVDCVEHKKSGRKFALKKISKGIYYQKGIISNLINEKNCLLAVHHPFIIQVFGTYQDDQFCYFLLELVTGAEFFETLITYLKFDIPSTTFYAANVVLAFAHLHKHGIVYRDTKPENLLLDSNGYIKLIDLGFCKAIGSGRTETFCGTLDYLAPELVKKVPHGFGVDWWSLGILIYEMLIGRPPFRADTPDATFDKITSGKVRFPKWLNEDYKPSRKVIKKFLKQNPDERLGVNSDIDAGLSAIKSHPWFDVIEWDKLESFDVQAPLIPSSIDSQIAVDKNIDFEPFDMTHNDMFKDF